MNSRSQIRCYKPAFVLQRYFCTFVANPSDSISDVVIQMHFLSLYKGRICVYSTRTDFKRNSYTNSYTNFFSAPDRFLKIRNFSPRIARVIQTVIHIVIHDFRHLEKFIKFSKSATQIATGRISKLQEVSNSEFLIAGSCKTVIHIVIQKSP